METQSETLKEKKLSFAAEMRGAKLTQRECREAVKLTITKTVEYAMEATMLSEKQWQSIMWPVWKTML